MHKNERQEMIPHAADWDFQNHVFSRLSSFLTVFFKSEKATKDHKNTDPTVPRPHKNGKMPAIIATDRAGQGWPATGL